MRRGLDPRAPAVGIHKAVYVQGISPRMEGNRATVEAMCRGCRCVQRAVSSIRAGARPVYCVHTTASARFSCSGTGADALAAPYNRDHASNTAWRLLLGATELPQELCRTTLSSRLFGRAGCGHQVPREWPRVMPKCPRITSTKHD